MWCVKLNCTLSTEACIKRQQVKLTKKQEKEFGYSYSVCFSCEQGKEVLKNPLTFINRDVNTLKKLYSDNTLKKTLKIKGKFYDRRKIGWDETVKLYGT